MTKHPYLLDREKTALLVIDVQEKILRVMHSPETVLSNTVKLIKGFSVLNLPVYYTEQYPKGLGCTVSDISNLIDKPSIQKMTFSCCGDGDLLQQLSE